MNSEHTVIGPAARLTRNEFVSFRAVHLNIEVARHLCGFHLLFRLRLDRLPGDMKNTRPLNSLRFLNR